MRDLTDEAPNTVAARAKSNTQASFRKFKRSVPSCNRADLISRKAEKLQGRTRICGNEINSGFDYGYIVEGTQTIQNLNGFAPSTGDLIVRKDEVVGSIPTSSTIFSST
jgi:hypothetical protein